MPEEGFQSYPCEMLDRSRISNVCVAGLLSSFCCGKIKPSTEVIMITRKYYLVSMQIF